MTEEELEKLAKDYATIVYRVGSISNEIRLRVSESKFNGFKAGFRAGQSHPLPSAIEKLIPSDEEFVKELKKHGFFGNQRAIKIRVWLLEEMKARCK